MTEEYKFQSTHPVWGATLDPIALATSARFQSTHPVWGATAPWSLQLLMIRHFNPRTPCGVRRGFESLRAYQAKFQSTHPVWGATGVSQGTVSDWEFQSTHPVWGATWCRCPSWDPGSRFQSTHPVWGATLGPVTVPAPDDDFNPRTPCGVRRGHDGRCLV